MLSPIDLPAAIAPDDVIASAHPWVRRLMRLGFIARGILYSLIGLFTLWSLLRGGSGPRGINRTFQSIHSFTPGVLLLAGLAVGFAGYAIGMMWSAVFNWNLEPKTTLGLLRRAGTFIAGLAHVSIVASLVLLIAGHQSEGHAARHWTQLAISYPFGRQGVVIGGGVAIGYGIFLLSKIITGRLDPQLDLDKLDGFKKHLFSWIGRFGMLANGIIYVTIGIILGFAGLRGDAGNVVGIGGAMRAVSANPYGVASLAILASGLVAYGALMFVEARYRKMGEKKRRWFF